MRKERREKEQFDTSRFFGGREVRAYEYFGVFLEKKGGEYLYTFRIFAGKADLVYLISDFTDWEHGEKMEALGEGIFVLTYKSPHSLEGKNYKYLIKKGEKSSKKGDPYARRSRGYDDGASVIYCEEDFEFSDSEYLKARRRMFKKKKGIYLHAPVNIYEMHPESFIRKESGEPLSFCELSEILPPYLKSMGYTHLELMPISEYPFDGSWGYQVGAFYAPTARLGDPLGLKKLINELHRQNIGVILDWVGAHFPKDEWGLFELCGEETYEYSDPDRRESVSWGTRYFDLSSGFVRSFLISNVLYYLREFHFDGIRADAVSAMIYLDHERSFEGSVIAKDGVEFLQRLNTAVFSEFSDVLMIAEESRSHNLTTTPVYLGGLGFNLKWNMGFANDMFDYISSDEKSRRKKHSALTFPITYAFSENYVLPISHDENVHGKKTLLDKCYGSYEDKFRTARLFFLMMMSFPGKKLSFMGVEIGQFCEWDYKGAVEWFMLTYPKHKEYREYIRALNHFYLAHPELYEIDFDPRGFRWIECDTNNSSVSYKRFSANGSEITVALNFSFENASVRVSDGEEVEILFSTEEGLSCKYKREARGSYITLPPLSGVYLRERRDKKIKL